MTSGAVALLLQAYPQLTPDQVKESLIQGAEKMSGSDLERGAGQIDIPGAANAAGNLLKKSTPATQTYPTATGSGSLDAARGGANLVDAETGTVLHGEIDVQNRPWNANTWWAAASTGPRGRGGSGTGPAGVVTRGPGRAGTTSRRTVPGGATTTGPGRAGSSEEGTTGRGRRPPTYRPTLLANGGARGVTLRSAGQRADGKTQLLRVRDRLAGVRL